MSIVLTPNDIRNPSRQSGFNNVKVSGKGVPKPFQANKGSWGGNADPAQRWLGPRRATALESAQDYCDLINDDSKWQRHVATLKSAKHPRRKPEPADPDVRAALGVLRDWRGQRDGQPGFVYLIGVEGDTGGVKIGYSTKPVARPGELQTGNRRVLVLLACKQGTPDDESALHAKYLGQNLLGEWFKPTEALMREFELTMADLPNGRKFYDPLEYATRSMQGAPVRVVGRKVGRVVSAVISAEESGGGLSIAAEINRREDFAALRYGGHDALRRDRVTGLSE